MGLGLGFGLEFGLGSELGLGLVATFSRSDASARCLSSFWYTEVCNRASSTPTAETAVAARRSVDMSASSPKESPFRQTATWSGLRLGLGLGLGLGVG